MGRKESCIETDDGLRLGESDNSMGCRRIGNDCLNIDFFVFNLFDTKERRCIGLSCIYCRRSFQDRVLTSSTAFCNRQNSSVALHSHVLSTGGNWEVSSWMPCKGKYAHDIF
jgi:hypothetical protein